jgi:hypothetical protein
MLDFRLRGAYSSSLSDTLLAMKNFGLFRTSAALCANGAGGSIGVSRREIEGFSGVKPRTILLDTLCKLRPDMALGEL